MRINSRLLGLPASLILFVTSHAEAAVNYKQSSTTGLNTLLKLTSGVPPDHQARNEQVVTANAPVGVMKMSDDPGEKFYMEYWQNEGISAEKNSIPQVQPLRARDLKEEVRLWANASAGISFRPPFSLHTNDELAFKELKVRRNVASRQGAAALAALEKRDFSCPAGTSDCSAIGSSNACCATGETCFNITDTGLGSVGCCPDGATCGGTISTCNSPNTPCASGGGEYEYGGCCIPNYVCAGVGCVIDPNLAVTVIVTQTFTIGSTESARTTTRLTTRTSVTSSITTTSSPSSITTTSSSSSYVCSTGWSSCAASLGGGCCQNGYTCASNRSCTNSASTVRTTATGVAPVRPTNTDSDSSSTTSTTSGSGTCPTGFYACSAYYNQDGCCRTGRDCQPTSCPPTSDTTIISSGVTIVVPVGSAAAVATPTGECASGWSTCAASVGGNCCPSGYACGTASCSLISATQTAVVQKGSPNSGTKSKDMWIAGTGFLIWLPVWVGILV